MREFRKPNRPKNEISQTYNSGIVNIFNVTNNGAPGKKPVEKLIPLVSLRYEERKLGIQRYYQAKQNQTEISRVIRVPKPGTAITNRDIAYTEDGEKYRIDLVQNVAEVYPVSLDLTLVKYVQGADYPR